jgi:NADH dehydrogenase
LVRDRKRAEQESRLQGLAVELVEADVTQPKTLESGFEGGEAVIHTVAIAIEKSNLKYEEINAQGTFNVLEAAKAAGIRRFINISQLGADSKIPYRFLASKGKAQEYVAKSGLDWTAFRPSVIWGPEDEFANTFAKLVPLTPIIFPIVDQHAKFQPVWVDDVAEAVVKALDDPTTFQQEYELGGPEILSLEEIERRTLRAIGAKRIFVPFPRPLLKLVVSIMESLLPSPPVTKSLLELLQVNNVTTKNALEMFVPEPKKFTPENTAPYMQKFSTGDTLRQFFEK